MSDTPQIAWWQSNPSILLNGLVGFWNLDGNSNDSLGLSNGIDTNITYGSGLIGQAAVFPVAQNGKINLGNNTRFNLVALTISAWINTTQTTASNLIVFAKSHNVTYYLNVSPNVNDISFFTANQHTNPGGGITNIADGNWHHIAATYSQGSKVLYWDNTVVASDNFQSPIGVDSNNVYIGNSDSAPGDNFIGSIDMCGLYNFALPSTSISLLYNSQLGKQYPF